MDITYSIPGLSKLQQAVHLAPGQIATRDAMAIESSLQLVKGGLESEIATGPGHFGFHARYSLFTKIATGRAITGTLYTLAPQLRWEEAGTRVHEISPRHAGALFLPAFGRLVAVVRHPGERARHLFKNRLSSMKSSISGIFADATQQVVDQIARDAK